MLKSNLTFKDNSQVKKINTRGSSAVEVLLIFVVAVILGLTGWYVYNANKKTNTLYNSTAQTGSSPKFSTKATKTTYTDPAKVYTVKYLSTWTVTQGGSGDTQPAQTVDPLAAEFVPPHSPSIATDANIPNEVSIDAYKTGDTQSILNSAKTGDVNTVPKSLTINGAQALYQQNSATTQITYTDDCYAVTHNGVTLRVIFREKQGGQSDGQTASFNATTTVPDVTALVKSIKFLN